MTELSVLKVDEGEGGMHEYRNPPPHLARAYKKQTTPPLSHSSPIPSRARRVNGRQLSAVIGEFKTATPH